MNQALLLSIKPRFADAIFEGTKTFELRRVRPKVAEGDLVLVYVSSPRSTLEGAFSVSEVMEMPLAEMWKAIGSKCGVSKEEFFSYFKGKEVAFAIGIAKAWPLAKAVGLTDLKSKNILPPQSYRYLTKGETGKLLNKRLVNRVERLRSN